MSAPMRDELEAMCGGVNPFPWDFGVEKNWHGRYVSLDGTAAGEFSMDDVAEIVAQGSTEDRWDGTVAAVLRLKDGRFVSWETFYGPTGDGFSEDAYGGDADLSFGASFGVVWRMGLTDDGRRLLDAEGVAPEGCSQTSPDFP